MYDLSQPIPTSAIIGAIIIVAVIIGIGLLTVLYYKKRLKK